MHKKSNQRNSFRFYFRKANESFITRRCGSVNHYLLLVMLIAIDNGYQCCLITPTEILAIQHFNSISKFLNNMDLQIELLTGSTKASKRKQLLEDTKTENISIQ